MATWQEFSGLNRGYVLELFEKYRQDPSSVDPETRAFFNKVWEALDAAGIPFTLHWGKYNSFLTPIRVRDRYGDTAVDQWLASRETLLESAAVRQIFNNDFTTGVGLAN